VATASTALAGARAAVEPAEWSALYPDDPDTKWQVWYRETGPGYWLMRYAARLANLLCRVEGALGREAPAAVANPNALEDGGTWHTREDAREVCRIVYAHFGGRVAVTYTPVLLGRGYPLKRVTAAGDRYFDPFKVFDFSATDAAKEQVRSVLVDERQLQALHEALGERGETVVGRMSGV
jgi:hypothetical protein